MKIQRILIAVDDSKYSENAASYGFDLARNYGADVGLVNIVEVIIPPPMGTNDMLAPAYENELANDPELLDAQKSASENIIDRTIKNFAGNLNVTHFTDYGPTADGILKCASEFSADMLVLGTHSRTGLDRLLMGSTAEHVVRHSEIPVLVVPLREAESQ